MAAVPFRAAQQQHSLALRQVRGSPTGLGALRSNRGLGGSLARSVAAAAPYGGGRPALAAGPRASSASPQNPLEELKEEVRKVVEETRKGFEETREGFKAVNLRLDKMDGRLTNIEGILNPSIWTVLRAITKILLFSAAICGVYGVLIMVKRSLV